MSTDASFNQSPHEERANALSHALGGLLVCGAAPALADGLAVASQPMQALGWQVFMATLLLMYGVSTVYHALPVGAAKRLLRKCDHAVIFVFIAGSYTPFALHHMQQGAGGEVLGLVWAIALGGMLAKLRGGLGHPLLSTGLYLAFGWMVLLVARPMVDGLPPAGRALLVAGGLAYTVGAGFYLLDKRLRYSHLVWHLFVITGSSCHVLAVQQLLA